MLAGLIYAEWKKKYPIKMLQKQEENNIIRKLYQAEKNKARQHNGETKSIGAMPYISR